MASCVNHFWFLCLLSFSCLCVDYAMAHVELGKLESKKMILHANQVSGSW